MDPFHLNTVIREAQRTWKNMSLVLQYRKFMTSCGMNSATGILRWLKFVCGRQRRDPKAANDALWTFRTALTEGLKLLHPYMPFITEEIYCTLLPEEESIMISDWPVYKEKNFADAEKAIGSFQERLYEVSVTQEPR